MLAHELRRRVAALFRDSPRRGRADAGADTLAVVRVAARTVATAREVTIGVDAPLPPVLVQASATMLRQAIENLLDNASHGGVEIGVRPDPDRGRVDIVVADRGLRAGQEDTAGHGIGLFLMRRFLDDTGGRPWVVERPGGGTLVGLRPPLRQARGGHLGDAVNT
jgi:K+-sensing histidine kinase KdpD